MFQVAHEQIQKTAVVKRILIREVSGTSERSVWRWSASMSVATNQGDLYDYQVDH